MNFRTEYSMRGWRGLLVIMFGLIFLGVGVFVFYRAIDSNAPGWILVVTGCLGLSGIIMATYGVYGYITGMSYALTVVDAVVRWERADVNREIGRLDLKGIEEIVYTRAQGESTDTLVAIGDKDRHIKIPLEYVNGGKGLNGFLNHIRIEFPDIKITQR